MTLVYVLLIIVSLAVCWTILKIALRLTTRLFTCGCLALVVLVGIGWLIYQQVR